MSSTTIPLPRTGVARSLGVAVLATFLAALLLVPTQPAPFGGGPSASASGVHAVEVDPRVEQALATDTTVAVVVQTEAGATAQVRDAVGRSGGTIERDLPIVDGFSATITHDGLQTLKAAAGVRAVSLDAPVKLNSTDSTTSGDDPPDTTYVETMGADSLYAQGVDGTGVGIAIIDTGVNEIADLTGRVVGGVDLTSEQDGVDHFGHGTFLAGIAAGDGTNSAGLHAGVAPGAHVVPIKIAGANGATDVSEVLAAIQWATTFQHRYDIGVLNLSFGTDSTQSYTIDPLNYAVERAWDSGLVVVAAASNAGPEQATISKPADDPLVLTVGALDTQSTSDRADDGLADFSGRGPTAADMLAKPDLIAPGVSVVGTRAVGSTVDTDFPGSHIDANYGRASGTSFAAAATSGAVALLRQAHPDWTPDQVKGALKASAAAGPVGDLLADGAGSLEVAAAAALVDPAPANQNVPRGDASGSLAASRGSLVVEYVVNGNMKRLDRGVSHTVQDRSFDATDYRGVWSATTWTGNQWYGNQWYGNQWYGNQWYGNQWYGNQWYGNQWY